MTINTDEERKTLDNLSPFELNADEYCRRMNTLALLEILDELRQIRLVLTNPVVTVEPATVNPEACEHLDVGGGLSPYCRTCGKSL